MGNKALILTEKYLVAQAISVALNCRSRRDGYFEGDKYLIAWAQGHLAGLADPEEYDERYKKWCYEDLPIIPEEIVIKVTRAGMKHFKVIDKLIKLREITEIWNSCDAGKEGETIFRYIYTLTGSNKPVRRMWLKSLTEDAIREACNNLRDSREYDNLYQAGRCRNEADWLIGINASRAFSTKFKATFSIGRVQTSTLNMIAERELEIQNFVPEVYYRIFGDFKFQNRQFEAIYRLSDGNEEHTIIKSKEKAQELLAAILSAKRNTWNADAINSETKNEKPPLLYDLAELEKECNSKFGFSAKKTDEIAQTLYEEYQAITYPRTDSRYIPSDMKSEAKSTLENLAAIGNYKVFVNKVIGSWKADNPIFNDEGVTDHHAIIPSTNVSNKLMQLKPDELKVYDLIVRRFMAVFMGDYIYRQTSISIKNNGVPGMFAASTKVTLDLGWKEIYKAPKVDEQASVIESISQGDWLTLVEAKIMKNTTEPPPRYTDASLIEAMQHAGRFIEDKDLKRKLAGKGIGTSATRAGIIEKLITSEYIERIGRSLVPMEKGILLIKILDVFPELKSAELTAYLEARLEEIQNGTLNPKAYQEEIKAFTRSIVHAAAG